MIIFSSPHVWRGHTNRSRITTNVYTFLNSNRCCFIGIVGREADYGAYPDDNLRLSFIRNKNRVRNNGVRPMHE